RMREGAWFLVALLHAPVPHVAVENPVPHRYARALIGRPTQWLDPHDYGELVTKKTGLWLRGLPVLMADEDAKAATYRLPPEVRMPYWYGAGLGHRRNGHDRSRTPLGIAAAMAEQWGAFVSEKIPDEKNFGENSDGQAGVSDGGRGPLE